MHSAGELNPKSLYPNFTVTGRRWNGLDGDGAAQPYFLGFSKKGEILLNIFVFLKFSTGLVLKCSVLNDETH